MSKTPIRNIDIRIHCNGPECTKLSRPGSKYCSHECGLEQARRRMLLILPHRVQSFCEQPSVSTSHDAVKIEKLEKQLAELQERSNDFVDTRAFVITYLEGLAQMDCEKSVEGISKEKHTGIDAEGRCGICNYVTSNWATLQRHIYRCYLRIEKESNFTGPVPAEYNPDGFICDFFCKRTKRYCKRLKVLCFDHTKGDFIPKKICGAPLGYFKVDDFDWTKPFDKAAFLNQGICLTPDILCVQHINWIQSLIGLIDNTRINLNQSIDETSERIAVLKDNVNRCYDIPSLMETWSITNNTNAFGLPKNTDYVNNLPEVVTKKIDWSNEIAEIDKVIRPVVDVAVATKIDEMEKVASKEAPKPTGRKQRPTKNGRRNNQRSSNTSVSPNVAASTSTVDAEAAATTSEHASPPALAGISPPTTSSTTTSPPARSVDKENSPTLLRNVAPIRPTLP